MGVHSLGSCVSFIEVGLIRHDVLDNWRGCKHLVQRVCDAITAQSAHKAVTDGKGSLYHAYVLAPRLTTTAFQARHSA